MSSMRSVGGRLTGPTAGWDNALRNMAAAAVLREAEAAVRGEKRVTVWHGPDIDAAGESLRQQLYDAVHAAVTAAGYRAGGTISGDGERTVWRFPSTHVPAAVLVRAAAAAAAGLSPGTWRVDADD